MSLERALRELSLALGRRGYAVAPPSRCKVYAVLCVRTVEQEKESPYRGLLVAHLTDALGTEIPLVTPGDGFKTSNGILEDDLDEHFFALILTRAYALGWNWDGATLHDPRHQDRNVKWRATVFYRWVRTKNEQSENKDQDEPRPRARDERGA